LEPPRLISQFQKLVFNHPPCVHKYLVTHPVASFFYIKSSSGTKPNEFTNQQRPPKPTPTPNPIPTAQFEKQLPTIPKDHDELQPVPIPTTTTALYAAHPYFANCPSVAA
jgi:hypothetical protein